MKKLLFLCAIFCILASQAQERDIRAIEVELGGGMTFGTSQLKHAEFDKNKIGGTGFIEVRYNLRSLPLDVGLQIRGTIFRREMSRLDEKLNFSSGNFMLTSNYNFRRKTSCSLFAGLGVGFATFENSSKIKHLGGGSYADNGSDGSVCVVPRVGIELWHRLRLTCSYFIEEKANRHFDLSLGVAIGGGRK